MDYSTATEAEINTAVAGKLGVKRPCEGLQNHVHGHACSLLAYSTSIAAAWEIVEHLRKTENCCLQINSDDKGTECWIGTRHHQLCFAEADSTPLAICKAFLKLTDA